MLEIRHRDRDGSMRQYFDAADRTVALSSYCKRHAVRGDVFIGAALRTRAEGTKTAVERVWCLWADCDDPESVARLASFDPEPRYIVATGTAPNVQAYWPLRQWIAPEHAERLNRKLAHALGSDMRATDAARILRPPDTLNHKHDPPAAVRCIANVPGFVNPAPICALPDPPSVASKGSARPVQGKREQGGTDDLLAIPASSYAVRLTGREVNRTGHMRCPFPAHKGGQEKTPSLRVYEDASQGFHCFGCGASGSVYDFAANLWGLGTRGADFRELKARLREALG